MNYETRKDAFKGATLEVHYICYSPLIKCQTRHSWTGDGVAFFFFSFLGLNNANAIIMLSASNSTTLAS